MWNYDKYRNAIIEYQSTNLIADYELAKKIGMRYETFMRFKTTTGKPLALRSLRNIKAWVDKNIFKI